MDFFGMGPGELLVILILALILFGPNKLPELAQRVGLAVREFRAATRELTSEFQQAFQEVQASTTEVATSVLAVEQETRAALGEVANTTQEVARTVTADQAPAPATTPAAAAANSSVSETVAAPATTAAPASIVSTNGRREPSKDDPLADLVDLDALLDGRGSEDETSHWER